MIKDNPNMTAKERNLLKGAIRRTFVRSDLRKEALAKVAIKGFHVPERPRVTKWSVCTLCLAPTPTYLMQVDHIDPIVPVTTTLEEMTWDEVVDNTWCTRNGSKGLQAVCKPCHKLKTSNERKMKKQLKSERKK